MTICDLPRKRIFLTARSCVGSPFRHQGRNPAQGLDCVGLIIYVSQVLGLNNFNQNFNLENYKRIPGKRAISRQAVQAGFREREKSRMQPGDVVILRIGKYLEHSAIISDRGIIHACEKYGRVVEHGLDTEWRSKIISAYSFSISSHHYEGKF